MVVFKSECCSDLRIGWGYGFVGVVGLVYVVVVSMFVDFVSS